MNTNSTPISVTSDDVDSFRRSLSQLQTPSALERVFDWIGTNEKDSLIDTNFKNSDSSGTFFRCDYKIDNTTELIDDDVNLTSVFNKSVPLCESPQSIDSKSSLAKKTDEKEDILKIVNEFNKDKVQKNEFYPAPSSVESKKKELCSYLKLMTRHAKKEIFHSRNRRSTRVQNSEKKKIILKKCKRNDEISCEKSRIELDTFALQSFKDLHMVVDTSKYPLLEEHIDSTVFNFIMPPNTVIKEFNDFEYWIKPFINSDRSLENGESCIKNSCETRSCRNANFEPEIERNNKRKKELKRFKKRAKKKNNILSVSCKDEESRLITQENDFKNDSSLKSRKESKCIILIHEDTIINGHDQSTDHNLSNIEEEVINNKECDDMRIRIDYDNEHLNNEQKNRSELCNPQLPYFVGFTKEEINISRQIFAEFKLCTEQIFLVPEKQYSDNASKESIKREKNGLLGRNNINCNCNSSNPDEIPSKCTVTSDSYSSASEDSSSSSSTSISDDKSLKNQSTVNCESIKLSQITPRVIQVEPFNRKNEIQSLYSLLKKQEKKVSPVVLNNYIPDWDSDNSVNDKQKFSSGKNNSHFILFNKENGSIQNAVYEDFHLILVQELAVSMWNQTALGNVLGAQNLWIFNGETKRLILNRECTRKKSLEMTVSMENCVAYVELWTKEHKSDIRQGPVADVFAIVYFWLQKSNRMDKKVHQLENINGFSDDVQYVVLKSSLDIVVSWHSVIDDVKTTQVHLYTLASDFQTIVNVRALSRVEHYVSSLHNIEDCEELLMGCGDRNITLWNIEHGYVVASIKLNDIKLSLSTHWTKCDRGILFTVQQCVDKELRLIAINGRSHSWKKLKSYKPPKGFERIQNVYIENGVVISFYEEGILCWKAQSEEQILEETHETDVKYFPSGKYVIMTTEKTVFIRHALTHLLTAD